MTWVEYTGLGVTALIFLIGLATSLLPVVPGNFSVCVVGIFLFGLFFG